MKPTWTLHLGDCLEYLRTLPDGSVDAVVTDPPYGTGAWKRDQAGAGKDCSASLQVEPWDIWSTAWIDEAWRVSRGTVAMFCAPKNLPSLWQWCGERGWRLCFWKKTDPRPRFAGQPAYAFECFVVIGRMQPCGGVDVVEASAPRLNRDRDATGHPHQKPIKAARWALDLVAPPEGTVLDPFAGSGTTGVACLETGRNFIGCELSPEYHAIATRRLTEASAADALFAGVGA